MKNENNQTANSPWTPLLQRQTQHVWYVQNLKAVRFLVALCLDLSSYHLKLNEPLSKLTRTTLATNTRLELILGQTFNLFISLFSAPEKIEMILLRFLSSGTEGSGLELWLAESESLPEPVLKIVLLILTGGAGGLSSGSPLSHMARRWLQASEG